MLENKISTIDTNEGELNLLFRELLEGCRDDLEEAKSNVQMYNEAIIDELKNGGKERYGPLHNDALKIKGLARDRQLKLLNMFKDRVTNKEKINLNRKDDNIGGMPDIAEMAKVIDEIQKAKKENPITIEYSKSLIEQEEEELDVLGDELIESTENEEEELEDFDSNYDDDEQ